MLADVKNMERPMKRCSQVNRYVVSSEVEAIACSDEEFSPTVEWRVGSGLEKEKRREET